MLAYTHTQTEEGLTQSIAPGNEKERADAIEAMSQLFARAKPLNDMIQSSQRMTVAPSQPVSQTKPVGATQNNNSAARPHGPTIISRAGATKHEPPKASTSSSSEADNQNYPRISVFDQSLKFNVYRLDERQFKNALQNINVPASPSRPNSTNTLAPTSSKSMPALHTPAADSNLAGQTVDQNHPNWWVTMALISGLQFAVQNTSIASVNITEVDAESIDTFKSTELVKVSLFFLKCTSSFDSSLPKDPSIASVPFDFLNHAPLLFREIRSMCLITKEQYTV